MNNCGVFPLNSTECTSIEESLNWNIGYPFMTSHIFISPLPPPAIIKWWSYSLQDTSNTLSISWRSNNIFDGFPNYTIRLFPFPAIPKLSAAATAIMSGLKGLNFTDIML